MQTGTKSSEKQSLISEPQPSELLDIIAQKDHIIAEQQKRLKLLEEKLRLANVQRYGRSSEKLSFQKGLFDEAELEAALDALEQQLPEDNTDRTTPVKRRKKTEGFSDKLPRVRIELTLTDDEKNGASRTFFSKVKEELEIIPAKAQVLEYWQEKAVFEDNTQASGQRLVAAIRASHPLGKCMASPSTLAYIITAKYADALPLYRQERILQRYGGDISRTTRQRTGLSVWMMSSNR